MEMTTDEIVKDFRHAADKKKQLVILAQLNVCTVDEIRAELIKGGIKPQELPRTRKHNTNEAAEPDKGPFTPQALAFIYEGLALLAQQTGKQIEDKNEELRTLNQKKRDVCDLGDLVMKMIHKEG